MKLVWSPHIGCGLVMLASMAGCSNPGTHGDAASAPAVSIAAVAAARSSDGNATPAKHCSHVGFHWQREVTISPTLMVSNDGYCMVTLHVSSNTSVLLEVETPPRHGSLTTSGENTSEAAFRYLPDSGYVGPDSFALMTGRAGHAISAEVSVTVTK